MSVITTEQVGQMLASLAHAEITTEPELVEWQGVTAYTARADLVFPVGRGIALIILPPVEGIALPYHKGDTVCVVHNHGEAFVVGHHAPAVEHEGNTVVSPRAGKDVRLGSGSGEWEALALAGRLGLEVVSLKAQIDALATYVATMTASAGGATIGLGAPGVVNTATLPGGITGGDPASRAMGQKA